jgi:hypothetical protein
MILQYLPDFFRSKDVSIEKNDQGDMSFFLLCKKTESLSVYLWLYPSYGYAARRIRVEQNLEQLEAGKTVLRDSTINNFQHISNTWVPVSYVEEKKVVGRIYEPKNGKPVEKLFITKGNKREIVFSHFTVATSFQQRDFKMTSLIPNGTVAYMQDALQMEHVWFDGKIEPKTDKLMLRIARGGHRFIPGVWEPRFWFIAAGAFLIFLSLFFKIKTIIQNWRKK